MKKTVVMAAGLLALGAIAEEVPWIDLTGTNRICAASGSALYKSDVFDNDWFASLVSNTVDFFSSKEPCGLLLIVK